MKQKKSNKRFKFFLIIFFICLSVFIVRYKGFELGNQNVDAVLVEHAQNPDVFKNDWAVNASSEFEIRTGYAWLINLTDSLIGNYEITYMVLFFICMIIFSIGFYKIMFLLTKNYKLALFSILFPLIIHYFGIGFSFDFGGYLTPGIIAWSLAIWSIYFYLKEKYVLSFILLGFASLIQIIIGLLVYGILVFTLIFRKIGVREKLISIAKSFFFLPFFSVTLIPLLFNQQKFGSLDDSKIIYILAKFRIPWHFSPFSWPLITWVIFFAFFFLFVIAFRYSKINKKYKSIFKLFVIGVFIYYLIGVVFNELIPLKFLIKLQLFRGSEILNLVEFIFISEFVFYNIKEGLDFVKKRYSKQGGEMLFIFLITFLIILNCFFVFLFLHPHRFKELILISYFIILILILFIERKNIRNLLIALFIIGLIIYLFYNPLIGRNKYDEEAEKLFLFVTEETSEMEVFLIPPNINMFRIKTKRAIVVDFILTPFSEKSMEEWYFRILDVTNSQDRAYDENWGFNDLYKNYRNLNEEEVLTLKKEYIFSYAVFEEPNSLDFPIIYQNNKFVVYEIK